MYNLLVSGNENDWNGLPWTIEDNRCVNEYTDKIIIHELGSLSNASIQKLQTIPCIFAYEARLQKDPKFGLLRDITKRQGQIRVEYEIKIVERFLNHQKLIDLSFDLDIGKWELNRTHWAVKDVNLPKELYKIGIQLPTSVNFFSTTVDINIHHFDVALSFPGEIRPLVEEVARNLERLIGPNAYFYDENYKSLSNDFMLDRFK
jgi:hypothetical protein